MKITVHVPFQHTKSVHFSRCAAAKKSQTAGMALFTVENAAEMGRRSAEARKLAAEQPLPTVKPAQPAQPATESLHASAMQELESQMATIDRMLLRGDKLEARDWRDLTAARRQIFQQWQVLANIPNPGNLKPTKPRSARPTSEPDPTPQ